NGYAGSNGLQVWRERLAQYNTWTTRLFQTLGFAVNSLSDCPIGAVPWWRAGVPPKSDLSSVGARMGQNLSLMQGKRVVVLGVATNCAMGWRMAKACGAAAAKIALTGQGDAVKKRVEPLANELGGLLLGHCDVTEPATIDAAFDALKEKWGKIDFV